MCLSIIYSWARRFIHDCGTERQDDHLQSGTEAEKERTGDKEEIFLRLAKVASEYDVADELLWSPDLEVSVMCNDAFHWACSDGEDVTTHDDIDMLIQACKEADYDGPLLYCARKRGMRPQGAMYGHIDKKYWKLFDDAGPERDPKEFGNTPKPKK